MVAAGWLVMVLSAVHKFRGLLVMVMPGGCWWLPGGACRPGGGVYLYSVCQSTAARPAFISHGSKTYIENYM